MKVLRLLVTFVICLVAALAAAVDQEIITSTGLLTLTLTDFSSSQGSGTYIQTPALGGANIGDYSNNAAQNLSYSGRITGTKTQTISIDDVFLTSGTFPTDGSSSAGGHAFEIGGGILQGSSATSLVAAFSFNLDYSVVLKVNGTSRPDGSFSIVFRYGAYSLDLNNPLFQVDVPIAGTFASSNSWAGNSTHSGALFVPKGGVGYYNAYFGLYFMENLPATTATPEPSGLLALVLGTVAFLRRRKRV